jgi:predicted transcriptional regulator of viral defense system
MQATKTLKTALDAISSNVSCPFFTLSDLRSVLPELSAGAFKAVLSRASKKKLLTRICRGLYFYPQQCQSTGLELYHAAARLRTHEFNYISLETVLSDAGVISQIPLQWITLMSSGRSQTIECTGLGHIEFIHTKKKPNDLIKQLHYDRQCHLWRADIALAIRDMKYTQRNLDLIDWELVNKSI